ncbi:tRNA-splicing endonuclease subunit Sen34 [Prorops nasuta]|uniref:tRNA-splicing endonuclease subunit Sen34 n=1 Tax=Prorops nasuta TaxID=863751 RepID=UPI0034CDABD6
MSEIIDLILINKNVFIWTTEDWLKLRRDYRIIGELIGCLPKNPRQDIIMGLPLMLLSEEVTLLIEKGIVRVIQCPNLEKYPCDSLKDVFTSYREKLFEEQKSILREERKNQVTLLMDKIIEGKRCKILGLETSKKKRRKLLDEETKKALLNIEIDKEKLFKDEMERLPELEKSEALIQTHTVYPWITKNKVEEMEWNYPKTCYEKLRYKTFKDLWEKGYYITSGEKFGGDFLVYPGDPIMFHSQHIIQCSDKNEELPVFRLIGQCRISTHVRKTLVFATLSTAGDVMYQSFQWAESNIVKNN